MIALALLHCLRLCSHRHEYESGTVWVSDTDTVGIMYFNNVARRSFTRTS